MVNFLLNARKRQGDLPLLYFILENLRVCASFFLLQRPIHSGCIAMTVPKAAAQRQKQMMMQHSSIPSQS